MKSKIWLVLLALAVAGPGCSQNTEIATIGELKSAAELAAT